MRTASWKLGIYHMVSCVDTAAQGHAQHSCTNCGIAENLDELPSVSAVVLQNSQEPTVGACANMTDFPSFRPSKERPHLLFCCGAHSTGMHHSILQCNHDGRVVTCNILHVADGGIDLPSALEAKHWQSQHMIPGMDKEPPQNHSIPEPSGFQYASKHNAEVQNSLDLAALTTSALLRCAEAQCREYCASLCTGFYSAPFGKVSVEKGTALAQNRD